MKLFTLIFIFSFTYAQGVDAQEMDSIYSEAILFVSIFSVMSIVSFVVSKRNAKKYEQQNPLKERKDAKKKEELEDLYLNTTTKENKDKIAKLVELSQMLKEGIINKEEFDILKDTLNISKEK
jgi:hypothetical protein